MTHFRPIDRDFKQTVLRYQSFSRLLYEALDEHRSGSCMFPKEEGCCVSEERVAAAVERLRDYYYSAFFFDTGVDCLYLEITL